MVYRNNSSTNQYMLHRPRVNSLIQEGLQRPLFVMLAGPGYGKTRAMVDYVEKCDKDVLWLRLSALDNLPGHFWDHLTRTLKREHPELSIPLQELKFPNTISDFEAFARILENDIYDHGQVVWIFDDYGEINNQQVKEFIRMLVNANLENFCLVLISNALDSTESIAFMTSKRALLLADDLRFTQDEVRELYQMYDITLKSDELNAVLYYTEGWSLPLHLLVLQHDRLPALVEKGERLTHHAISDLFEERFFSNYTEQQQKLFVKLSLLDSFTREFVIDLLDGDVVEWMAFKNHAFLIGELATDRFFFHHLYRLFLQDKEYVLHFEEEQEVWHKAAKHYMAINDYMEAISCYRKCEEYMGMLEAISQYAKSQNEITETSAAYFLEHIDLLTPEQLKEYPMADYLRARIFLSMLKLDEAETLLLSLEKRLLCEELKTSKTLLIDVYTMLGNIHMMCGKDDFGDYFKKAAFYLPESGKLEKSNKLTTLNINVFSIADNQPGAKERKERAVHYGIPWLSKILSGGISGMEHLFSAESAYLSYQMDEAQQHAYRAIYKAEIYAQYDIVCNAHIILARIGYLHGDFDEMSKQIQSVVECADRYNMGVLKEIRDTALGWFYIKLRDYNKVPKSIFEVMKTEKPMLAYGRPELVYANYLINTGEYAKLIGMSENPRGLFLSGERGIWVDSITLCIMLAIGYYCLGNLDAAMDALWSAYEMCYNNGLVTLFVEGGMHMKELISTARRQSKYLFSAEWLDLIEEQAGGFAKRTDAVRAAYRRKHPMKVAKDNPLSERERNVLQSIAQGLTREEIALEQYISVNTVKSVIRSIYNKLGANNKADAVSIAITRGYIEGHSVK